MGLRQAIDSGKFIVTSEIGPPKGTATEHMMADAELLRGRVDGINVTDLQASAMRLGSLATCHLLAEAGFNPIFQMTCRDRNRLALQSDLLNAAVLGITDVLCLTGDFTTLGDHPHAKPVFDLDSVSLLRAATGLTEGRDMAGNELEGAPRFTLGAVVNPGAEPLEPQIIKLERKVEAGARFIQTQAVYDAATFERFVNAASHINVPILLGIVLLKSAGMAKYMNRNVAGVFVPDNLIQEMTDAQDKVAASVGIAARLINEMRPMVRGVHIMPIGWDKHVPKVLDAAGL
jgi:5,10-methylenetetrahydrofolate reductase